MRQRRNLAPILGLIALVIAVIVSGAALEATIFPVGTIVGTARRAIALNVCRGLLAVIGAYFLIRRPKIGAVHLSAFAAVGLVSGLLGALMLQVAFKPPAVLNGWKSTVAAKERNQLGFRGRPIEYTPQDHVVVLLGDSQVEAAALTFENMPERRLEAHLGPENTKVFSLGTGGYGQDQELLALEEYLRTFRTDLVVLWETPANDVWNNVFKTHMFNNNPKPTYWLDEAGMLKGPSEGLLAPLANSRIVVAALWQRALGLPWRDKSWERQLPTPYAALDHYDGAVRSDWQERWNGDIGRMRGENLATEKSHLSILLAPRSKRMQYGVDLTHALISRIQDVVTAHHARLVVFYEDTQTFDSENDEIYALNGKYYRVSKRQFEANLKDINSGFDTEVIPVTLKDWRVSPEDGHLNREATDLVMAALAERLKSGVMARQEPRGTVSE